MRNFLLGVLSTLIVLLLGGYALLKSGQVNLGADQQPSSVETRLAMSAVDASLNRHAAREKNPLPRTEENLVKGAKLYVDNCAGCHGVPSNPDGKFAHSFYPPAPGFFKDPPDMTENQNFYVILHGIRWTGMAAWKQTLTDEQVWQIVMLLSNIQGLPPAAVKLLGPPGTPVSAPEANPMHMTH
jgi:mono/diheme cytochrome c family protein